MQRLLMKLLQPLVAIMLFATLICFSFPELFDVDRSVQAGDAPVYLAYQAKKSMEQGKFASTSPAVGLGGMGPIIVGDFTALYYYFLPEAKVEEAIMATSVFFAAFFFFLFLRERRFKFFAALAGGLAMGFTTSLLSIVSAGHTGKFTGVAYLAGAMWFMQLGAGRKKWIWTLFGGLFVGYALAQARDVAIIVCLGFGAFWIYEIIVSFRVSGKFDYKLAIAYMAAGLIALAVTYPVMKVLVPAASEVPGSVDQENGNERWEWATQWSLPSGELMKLVVPSWCGWDSWDTDAPYWGTMGRTEGWEKHHQGFRNFTQTNEYIGLVVFFLAVVGLASRFLNGKARGEEAPVDDRIFWGAAGLIALLLALGKFFPLYRLFYALPMMSSIRNPVKFMHVVSFALAVLAAHGMTVFDRKENSKASRTEWVSVIFAGFLVLLFLMLLFAAPWESKDWVAKLSGEGFTAQLEGIKGAMFRGIARTLLISVILFVFTLAMALWRDRKEIAVSGVLSAFLLLIAADFMTVNSRYISYTNPSDIYRTNQVIDYLKKFPEYRCKFFPHNAGIFNLWNTVLVPYFFFKSADMPAESRRSPDLQAFYSIQSSNPGLVWKLMGIRHFIMPRQYLADFKKMFGDKITVVKAFDLTQQGNVISPIFNFNLESGQFVIAEYSEAIPCGKWVPLAAPVSFSDVFAKMQDPSVDFSKMILVDKDERLVDFGIDTEPEPSGVCKMLQYTETESEFECEANTEGWVFINDYFDGKWAASIDGVDVPVVRANGVFRAVKVPAGKNIIRFVYKGDEKSFWIPITVLGGLLALLVITTFIDVTRRKVVA